MVFGPIYRLIGDFLGEEKTVEELAFDVRFQPGLILDSGIWWVYTFKKMVIPVELRTGGAPCPASCDPDSQYNKCPV